jgi:hypothetical protein
VWWVPRHGRIANPSTLEAAMNKSPSFLRRVLLCIAFAGSLGFGATQAFATPEAAQRSTCQPTGYAYIPWQDCENCPGTGGYCDGYNTECVCFTVE